MYDTDDPAIWINPADPAQSLIIGTDKKTAKAHFMCSTCRVKLLRIRLFVA
ncbi:phytase [Mucilaginibacter sp. UC70_90]